MRTHPRQPLDPSTRVVIPVKVQDGKLVPFYGGEMPEFKEGWILDLVTEENALESAQDIARFNVVHEVKILPAGHTLFAVIANRLRDAKKRPPVVALKPQPALPSEAVLVPFSLKEDLKLHLRGTRLAELMPCVCDVGLAGIEPPDSVNQAYSRLSEHYEPWRRAHTGNVFDKVYYEAEKGIARPLRALRDKEEAAAEKELFHRSGELGLDDARGQPST